MNRLDPLTGTIAITIVATIAAILAAAGVHRTKPAGHLEDALGARTAPMFAALAIVAALILRTAPVPPHAVQLTVCAVATTASIALARAVGMLAGRRRDRTATAAIIGLWFVVATVAPIIPDPILMLVEAAAFLTMMVSCARAIGWQTHHSEILVDWFWDAVDRLKDALDRGDDKAVKAALTRIDETLTLVDGNPAQPTFAHSTFGEPEVHDGDLVLPHRTHPGKALSDSMPEKDIAQAFSNAQHPVPEKTFRYENLGETVAAGLGRFRLLLERPWTFDMGNPPPATEWPAGCVPLGRGPRGAVRYLGRHTATIAGETRAGKTTLLRGIVLANLVRGEQALAAGRRPDQVVILDPKGDLQAFANHRLVTYARTRHEAALVLSQLQGTVEERHGSTYAPGDPGWIVLVVDEALQVARWGRVAIDGETLTPIDVIGDLFSVGLGLGIQTILATQLTNRTSTGGSIINGNAQVRIGFRVPKPEHARQIIDETVAARGFNLANRRLPQGRFVLCQPGDDDAWCHAWETANVAALTRWKPLPPPPPSVPFVPSASATPHPLYTGTTPHEPPANGTTSALGRGGAWATLVPDPPTGGKHDRQALQILATHGPISLRDVARRLPGGDPTNPNAHASTGTTSTVLRRLERNRHAEQTPAGWVLTPAGRAALGSAAAA